MNRIVQKSAAALAALLTAGVLCTGAQAHTTACGWCSLDHDHSIHSLCSLEHDHALDASCSLNHDHAVHAGCTLDHDHCVDTASCSGSLRCYSGHHSGHHGGRRHH